MCIHLVPIVYPEYNLGLFLKLSTCEVAIIIPKKVTREATLVSQAALGTSEGGWQLIIDDGMSGNNVLDAGVPWAHLYSFLLIFAWAAFFFQCSLHSVSD